jgi:hypothetical protein
MVAVIFVSLSLCCRFANICEQNQKIAAINGSERYLMREYSGADKYLARPGKKQATATEDFEFHISYL